MLYKVIGFSQALSRGGAKQFNRLDLLPCEDGGFDFRYFVFWQVGVHNSRKSDHSAQVA